MKELLAKVDWSIVLLVVYGALSDVIGASKKTEAGSVPGFFILVLKSLAKNIPSARAKKK